MSMLTELFPQIHRDSTVFVAIMSTPVPAASQRMVCPVRTGAGTRIFFSALMQSKIFSFGISVLVFTETAGRFPPSTTTVVVTVLTGDITSCSPYTFPLLQVFPSTETTSFPFRVTVRAQPIGHPMQVRYLFSMFMVPPCLS